MLAEARAGEEVTAYADLDLGRIAQKQAALDVVGHYNRERHQARLDHMTPAEYEAAGKAA